MRVIEFSEHVKALILSFLLSFSLGFLLLRLSYRYKLLDLPFGRKKHFSPVALGGGITVFLSMAMCSMACGSNLELLTIASLLVLVGFVDDVFDISPSLKLVFQIVSAAVWIYLKRPLIFGNAFMDSALGIFWIVSVTNAFNFVDGIDGLASGVGAITFLGLAIRGVEEAFPLVGAALGFFLLNYPPARIFLGDAGSYLLGFLSGALTLDLLNGFDFINGTGVFLLVAFPLADLTWAVLRRWAHGKPITVGDDRHIHHLLKGALGDKGALLSLLTIHAFLVGIGVFVL